LYFTNGNCSCISNYFGEYCDERCADSECNIYCQCNDSSICLGQTRCTDETLTFSNNIYSLISTNLSTFNNLALEGSILLIQADAVVVLGNLNVANSKIQITSASILIDKNLTISNSTIFFNSSTLVSKGCINVTNSNFSINLANTTEDASQIVLMQSDTGCLNIGSFNISFFNTPKCLILKDKVTESTLVVLLIKDPSCDTSNIGIQPWEIALIIIGSIIVIIIILIVIIMLVPELKAIIFPSSKIRRSLKTRLEDEETLDQFRDKMKNLKNQIKEAEVEHEKVKKLFEEEKKV